MKERAGLVVLAMFLLFGGVLVYLRTSRPGGAHDHDHDQDHPARPDAAAAAATTITLLYSSEKEEWLREAVASWQSAHPDVRVELEAQGSIDSVRSLMANEKRPTLWAPADSLAENLFATQWQIAHGEDPLVRDGTRWPRSLLLTPLVFVIWESRARVLLGQEQNLRWQRLRDAVALRAGWQGLGGDPAWAFVKFGHTDPQRSNSGLQALVLMAYGFYDRQQGLTVQDVTAQPFQDFLRALESGRQRQDFGATSTGTFMQNMLRQGPSLYDVAVVYEALAITSIPRAAGRWEALRVYYPNINLWNDHPLCLFRTDWVTPAQRRAAEALADHLMSAPVQHAALRRGFRPGNLDVPMLTNEPDNPFNRFRDMGIATSLPRVAQAPDGAVLQALLQTWQRNQGN
ncbi:MAG: substrate-binding domain-containing protein [Deltaproteobacteria bacterium]|nr:substrate-binding domain-containing protein [Deltaproteobacteria bacterium]